VARPLYTQTVIALLWDFDRTLIPGYSQTPLFARFGIDEKQFWDETNDLVRAYGERGLTVGKDTIYLAHLLTYVKEGKLPGLTNSQLRDIGKEIPMCPGIPDFLDELRQRVREDKRFAANDIEVEHYVISTGIKPLIAGSAVGPFVKQIWANEFIDQMPLPNFLVDGHNFEDEGVIEQVGFVIDNSSKTRAVFEINKGPGVDVNARVPEESRRVPIQNMIYICDGVTDVPVCSILLGKGGRSLGVYQAAEPSNYGGVKQLEDDGRVNSIAPADFSPGAPAYLWLMTEITSMATHICDERDRLFAQHQPPAGHVT
jgi:hypothetical protein